MKITNSNESDFFYMKPQEKIPSNFYYTESGTFEYSSILKP